MAVLTLLAFFVLAATNWMAAAQDQKNIEYVVKPATLAALLLFAAAGDNPSFWLIAALVFCLLGDIYLMLPGNYFIAGLAAFLLGHLAYITDFDARLIWRVVWFVIVAGVTAPVAMRILRSITDESLKAAVVVYMVVLSFMAASAIASRSFLAAAGSLLFVASDSILAWDRFVKPIPLGHFYVMVTYHLAQLGLATSLRHG